MNHQSIKTLRVNNNATQKEIADFCGISIKTYQRIESGQRKGDVAFWRKLAAFYSTTIDDLLRQVAD